MHSSTFDQLDPEGFEVYVQWLYSQQIPSYDADIDANARCIRMLKAHLLGNTVRDQDFLLAVRNEIIETAVEAGLGYNAIDYAYKTTRKPCSLRRFLVDLYALTGDAQSLKEGNVSHLFLIDLAQSFMEKSKNFAEGKDVWSMLVAEGHIKGDLRVPEDGGKVEDEEN
ncbi:zinc ion binding [Ascochyta rabiei]|uniref:Zinc ion binding n=2 Tax=Didymella rabiei TaxID=5454 RepID=A0A163H0V2_DIDRA|nr:zinc ion binding [Ascochyta rabiei]